VLTRDRRVRDVILPCPLRGDGKNYEGGAPRDLAVSSPSDDTILSFKNIAKFLKMNDFHQFSSILK
jgi:hypothetical protein